MSTSFKWQYPGDPVDTCEVVSRAEFMAIFPPETRNVQIHSGELDGKMEAGQVYPMGDEIVCDFCSADCGDEVWLIYRRSKGVCRECGERVPAKYRIGE